MMLLMAGTSRVRRFSVRYSIGMYVSHTFSSLSRRSFIVIRRGGVEFLTLSGYQ